MYKLLIVEDDPGIAEGIKAQTEAWGLEVRTVENFRNVLAEFSEYRPHIVLQRLPLVQRNSQGFKSTDNFHFFGLRQYEHSHGNEHGCR